MFTSRQLLCAFSFAISAITLTASETNESGNSLMKKAHALYAMYEPRVANAAFQFPLNPLNLEKQRISKTRALEISKTEKERMGQLLYACSENSKQERMKGYGNVLLGLCAVSHKLRVFGPTLLPTVMLGAGGLVCCGLAASHLPHYDIPTLVAMHAEYKKTNSKQTLASDIANAEQDDQP